MAASPTAYDSITFAAIRGKCELALPFSETIVCGNHLGRCPSPYFPVDAPMAQTLHDPVDYKKIEVDTPYLLGTVQPITLYT